MRVCDGTIECLDNGSFIIEVSLSTVCTCMSSSIVLLFFALRNMHVLISNLTIPDRPFVLFRVGSYELQEVAS